MSLTLSTSQSGRLFIDKERSRDIDSFIHSFKLNFAKDSTTILRDFEKSIDLGKVNLVINNHTDYYQYSVLHENNKFNLFRAIDINFVKNEVNQNGFFFEGPLYQIIDSMDSRKTFHDWMMRVFPRAYVYFRIIDEEV